jgi:hypothetical protein
MKKNLLFITCVLFVLVSRAQVLFNEVYTDPAASHNEFFELYNTSTSSSPISLDDYTIVVYFETPKDRGFYVMDLPNLSIAPKGYFVGASNLPFDYQGVQTSTAADFSWNSSAFTSNNGYVKEWLLQPNNTYAEVTLPADFNDFFFRRLGSGGTYSIFLYKQGVIIESLIFGTGGATAVLPAIINMPPLFVDMTASSPDFTINFSTYGSNQLETVMQDAGNDNGYYRVGDGYCGGWTKSDNKGQHNPHVSNGYVDGYGGVISVTATITRGTALTGSQITYDVISAPTSSFPVTLELYSDQPTLTRLEANDIYVASNTETVVTDGPFTTPFTPYDANMLVVVKSSLGCIDKVMFIPNLSILPVKLIYFQGNRDNEKVRLQWNVGQNESSDHFEIEKSYDGKTFTTTGLMLSTTRAGSETYSFSETANEKEKIFYRLKMIDKTQKVEYSRIIVFQPKLVAEKNLTVINNPAHDRLTISFESAVDQNIDVKVYDLLGKIRMVQPMNLYKGSNLLNLSLSSSITAGLYIVELANKAERYSAKFIKQ